MAPCSEATAACGSLALISVPDGTGEVAQEWKCSEVSSNTGLGDNTCLDNALGGILGVSCAGPGTGLDEPDGPLPTQLIP